MAKPRHAVAVMELPPLLHRVLTETPALRRAYLVGGCVRDWLLGRAVKDFSDPYGPGREGVETLGTSRQRRAGEAPRDRG